MKERPILFGAPMVRAILAGTKTQTRRLVTTQGWDAIEPHDKYPDEWSPWRDGEEHHSLTCPYGAPGDRLWVREAFARTSDLPGEGPVVYREGGERGAWVHDGGGGRFWMHHGWTVGVTQHSDDGKWFGKPARWTPGIHMPRWASRLTLEVTGVRVERLQDISEADCLAEGVLELDGMFDDREYHKRCKELGCAVGDSKPTFAMLWDSINGKRCPWAMNPWLWVVEFPQQRKAAA